MPELAEVEFYRRRWSAGHGDRVRAVRVHAGKPLFRQCDPARLVRGLTGATLLGSEAAAKQMLFRFSGGGWLGLHLGMSGELRVEAPAYAPARHDHLILVQRARQLVFSDPRMFGAVRWHQGPRPPEWWTRLPPPIRSAAFTPAAVGAFLQRRRRAPLKAVLLQQERFPGIGNWMADEVLWRAGLHPRRAAGGLTPAEVRRLHRACRTVCRQALAVIAGAGGRLPPDLNAHIPRSWLFWHRWEDGGRCPRTGVPLVRETIGGRTTCWSPGRQRPS
ncbi:MAG: Fpg/Nei family DNA glycosylase [Opitutaceae bacterium]|nr:Fpg/Nei family DNA glycosylase [Opitutaceae bacterium]